MSHINSSSSVTTIDTCPFGPGRSSAPRNILPTKPRGLRGRCRFYRGGPGTQGGSPGIQGGLAGVQGGLKGLRSAGLNGIRIGGCVTAPPDIGVPELLSVIGVIVLSVKGSKKFSWLDMLLVLLFLLSEAALAALLGPMMTAKANAPNNILE